MWTIGSHIKGVKVAICWELAIEKGNRTNGSGKKDGKSTEGTPDTLRDGVGVNRLDDLEAGNKEESGGKDKDSVGMIGSCEGAIVYCKADTRGGHQQ